MANKSPCEPSEAERKIRILFDPLVKGVYEYFIDQAYLP